MSEFINTTTASPQEWELLSILDQESSKVKVLARLLSKGYKAAFAPDVSEINNYIAPYRDFRLHEDRNQSIRFWQSTKTLLNSRQHQKVIIPPYQGEIQIIIRA